MAMNTDSTREFANKYDLYKYILETYIQTFEKETKLNITLLWTYSV